MSPDLKSSTHARGGIRKEHELVHFVRRLFKGIVPAYAGNTEFRARTRPHSAGSSPHTRGTRRASGRSCRSSRDHPRIRGEHLRPGVRHALVQGIIPAYAGNTQAPFLVVLLIEGSSPHTRGTPARRWSAAGRAGDHPRIRGEHGADHAVAQEHAGIIPAYAGNTIGSPRRSRKALGSSPHTRGTRGPA